MAFKKRIKDKILLLKKLYPELQIIYDVDIDFLDKGDKNEKSI